MPVCEAPIRSGESLSDCGSQRARPERMLFSQWGWACRRQRAPTQRLARDDRRRAAKTLQNSGIGPLKVLEQLDEGVPHFHRLVLGSAIVSGEGAASRHCANNLKNALSQFRKRDDSLSTAIAMLVSVPSTAPPKTSIG